MLKQIIVISGPVSVGKSTLVKNLQEDYSCVVFKTRNRLKELYPNARSERGVFQELGENLDKKTKGRWVCDGLKEFLRHEENRGHIVIVDAVRIKEQINCIRQAYAHKVIHVHLHAPYKSLQKRYSKRKSDEVREFSSYEEVEQNQTERNINELAGKADIVIDTHLCTPQDVAIKTICQLGYFGRQYLRLVDVLVGGQYGSEGKGHIASYLAREYSLLVRVGGPNAGHKVFHPPMTFHHLPSGTLTSPDSKILIGPGATIHVPSLLEEIAKSQIDVGRLFIDPKAMVISEQDRRNEAKLVQTIGSTGQGVGYANARRIRNRYSKNTKLAKDIIVLKPYIYDGYQVLEDAYRIGLKIFLEGTQGTGLSLYHGDYPHVTSRDTTVAGCLAEAGISPNRTRKIIMVCRTYPIRVENPTHGFSGDMRQEIKWSVVEKRSGYRYGVLKKSEHTSTTNRLRRVSEFDWELLRKAASLNAPTDIAISFVDYIRKENENARRFEQLTKETIRFIEEVEKVASAPVSLISTRFNHSNRSIIDRRTW